MGLWGWGKLFRKNKDSRHENHSSHSQKLKNNKPNDATYRSDVPNDGFPRGYSEDPAKRAPHRHGKSSEATQVHKPPKSVVEQITFVGDYIDSYNKTHSRSIDIDIIILGGLLDIDQKLTEPKSGSGIRFINNPKKPWREDLHSRKLREACKNAKWHTTYPWSPDTTLDISVQEEMFRATEHDKKVYLSGEGGMMIRKQPPDYSICRRINRLGDPRSNPQQSASSEFNKIVEAIQSYIDKNERHLKDKQTKSKQRYRDNGKTYDISPMADDCGHRHHHSQSVMIPNKLIEKWQNNYRFSNIHLWLYKLDHWSCQMSLQKRNQKHRHIIGRVVIGELSKSREPSTTRNRSRHDSHGAKGPHDSASSLRTDSDIGHRPPSKTNTSKSSDYGSDSGTSTRGRRGHSSSQPPSQQKLPGTASNRGAVPKRKPLPPQPPPSIIIDPSNYHEERRGKSPGKSPSRRSPRRSPNTADPHHVHRDPSVPPLPPPSHSPYDDRQKSPARPGSSGRGMAHKKSQRSLLDPNTIPPHSDSHTNNHKNSKPKTVKSKKSRQTFVDTTSNSQPPPPIQPYPPSNSYNNYSNNISEPLNSSVPPVSPLSPSDPFWGDSWQKATNAQRKQRHEDFMEELARDEY